MDIATEGPRHATRATTSLEDHGRAAAKARRRQNNSSAPTRSEVEAAVAVLIRWAGDDPARPGLADTPARVTRAFEDWFGGYDLAPDDILGTTFDEIGGYADPVELRDIAFFSWCEHHMAPIRGKAHIAYLPSQRVIGISKLARLVDAFARRLQIQERMTDQIGAAIQQVLQPAGVAVVVEARHDCMSSRGIRACGTGLVTKAMFGAYREDAALRGEFLASLQLR